MTLSIYLNYRYESQSLAIEDYFPSALKLSEEMKGRKQSLYLEESENLSKIRQKSESTQEDGPQERFRARSGTDISNSLLSARLKYRRLHSLNSNTTEQTEVNSYTSLKDISEIIEHTHHEVKSKVEDSMETTIAETIVEDSVHKEVKTAEFYLGQDNDNNDVIAPYEGIDNTENNSDDENLEFEDCFSRKVSYAVMETGNQSVNSLQMSQQSINQQLNKLVEEEPSRMTAADIYNIF